MKAGILEEQSAKVLGAVVPLRSYVAILTPATMKELLFVSTFRSEDPMSNAPDKHGYQRPPDPARFPKIASFFLADRNAEQITPMIVSVRLKEQKDIEYFLKHLEAGDISGIKDKFGKKIASVVDGQHRMHGLLLAADENSGFIPQVPVMLFFGSTFIEEAQTFNTINVTQRKLPKALIETTKGDITNAGDEDYSQLIRRIALSLCRDEDSVWGDDQVNMTGTRDPEKAVTFEGIRRSTESMFPETLLGRLRKEDPDEPTKLAKRYWKAVKEACADAWEGIPEKIDYRIKDLVGVASLAKLGMSIITSEIESKEEGRLEELVRKLSSVDWEKRTENPWMQGEAGFAGQKELHQALYNWVYNDQEPGVAN